MLHSACDIKLSGDNSEGLVLSFHLHVDSEGQSQDCRAHVKDSYHLNHLTGLWKFHFKVAVFFFFVVVVKKKSPNFAISQKHLNISFDYIGMSRLVF